MNSVNENLVMKLLNTQETNNCKLIHGVKIYIPTIVYEGRKTLEG